ncbi:MAG: hypothetical protein MI922_06750, partial [Bacteroidales bacterium]|nr:hypothetical protein [Bacteroidales bacterium]
MKKNSTPIKSTILCVLMSACLFLSGTNTQAQIVFDYVADSDGNWSDDATWQGGTSPGDSVGESHIKINKNVTVTLDVSVTVDGNDSSMSKVFINEGTIDGTGRRLILRNTLFRGRKPLVGDNPLIKVDTTVFGKGTNYKFDGLLKCHDLVNRGGKVIVDSGKIMVRDNLILQRGVLIINDTARFRVSDSINVRLKGGRIINRSGTPLIGIIPRMMFDQRMDSLKALAPRIHHVDINLPGKADSVVLAEDIEIDSLILNKGILRLKDKKLVVTGKFTQDSGLIAGSVKARMVIQGTGDPIRLKMEKGKRKLKMLHIAREVILDDSLSIADTLELDKDAIMELTKGVLIVNGKAKIAKGKLRGSKHAAIQFKKGEM